MQPQEVNGRNNIKRDEQIKKLEDLKFYIENTSLYMSSQREKRIFTVEIGNDEVNLKLNGEIVFTSSARWIDPYNEFIANLLTHIKK